jgi:hypothetical protein
MTIVKRVLDPQRQRQTPEHFSWIEHRLVREQYIELTAGKQAMAELVV